MGRNKDQTASGNYAGFTRPFISYSRGDGNTPEILSPLTLRGFNWLSNWLWWIRPYLWGTYHLWISNCFIDWFNEVNNRLCCLLCLWLYYYYWHRVLYICLSSLCYWCLWVLIPKVIIWTESGSRSRSGSLPRSLNYESSARCTITKCICPSFWCFNRINRVVYRCTKSRRGRWSVNLIDRIKCFIYRKICLCGIFKLVVLLKQGMNQPRRLLGLHLGMDMDPSLDLLTQQSRQAKQLLGQDQGKLLSLLLVVLLR